MEREIDKLIKEINQHLKKYEVQHSFRYGYHAIDIGYALGSAAVRRTLISGLNTKEVYNYLSAMAEILEIKEEDKNR